jgi:ketosteroid isomerase-like protein
VTSLESQNTEQVARIFEAFARGDVPYILDQLADDVRFHSHLDASVPWAGEFVGKENVVRFFQALGGSIEVAEHPVTSLVAQGDTVVATGDVSFKVRETGKGGSSSWVYIWKLEGGAVRSYDQFNDTGLSAAFR